MRHSLMPLSLAWEAFGNKNGTNLFNDFRTAIYKYRNRKFEFHPDPTIGCIILTMPFFFEKSDWIPAPEDWHPSIVQGKTYDTETAIGNKIYEQVMMRIIATRRELALDNERFGAEQTLRPRIGQGAFKVMVTEAYHRRCAITGEKTLPVLEAAHIQPYSHNGPHLISNGLLLRRGMHTLFDRGYLTINDELRIEVSKRIKEDYGNGKEYYAYHGKSLLQTPSHQEERPSSDYLRWHNENVFLA